VNSIGKKQSTKHCVDCNPPHLNSLPEGRGEACEYVSKFIAKGLIFEKFYNQAELKDYLNFG
jgi:hypothetical protein